MGWYSVLPSHLTVYETWIIRTFIVLAIVNMAPWTMLIIYDFLLYIFRTAYHEIPVYGGRARGEVRPRAPSLVDGRRRRISMAEMITGSGTSPHPSGPADREQLRSRHANMIDTSAIDDDMGKL